MDSGKSFYEGKCEGSDYDETEDSEEEVEEEVVIVADEEEPLIIPANVVKSPEVAEDNCKDLNSNVEKAVGNF